jgi:dTDP-4-amino-4,6-dideoxygalactose transaminase
MTKASIPFNRPFAVGSELDNIREAISYGHLSGDGKFTAKCNTWIAGETHASKALLTHSCTAALEMAALLSEVGPGDEVIMPSYTFVSTANAFALRGATPVFVDIRADTLNLDETLIAAALTDRTRAIVPVHYAGVGCEMDSILALAQAHDLLVIEDAAQAVLSTYRGRPLGALGDMGAVSYHETKNVISGEGGALLLRDADFVHRAEIIREKGTNRTAFFRGQVDKYTWVDIGSSYLPSELVAAFLWAQLEQAEDLTKRRLNMWDRYHEAFAELEADGLARRPIVPEHCTHNAHMYYLLLESLDVRQAVLSELRALSVGAIFHYVPLHSAPAGLRYGRAAGGLPVTDRIGDCLMRLPLWIGLEDRLDEVINRVRSSIVAHSRKAGAVYAPSSSAATSGSLRA